MKHFSALILFGALMLSMPLLTGCDSAPIPQRTMMDIYYDMFTIDQAVADTPEARSGADTLSVYGGIFARYGYSIDQYLEAVDYYLRHPEGYARMMKKVQSRINKDIKTLEAEAARLEAAVDMPETESLSETAEEPDDDIRGKVLSAEKPKRKQNTDFE